MSSLEEEFFNLLRTSETRWTTLHIEGRTWVDVEVQNLAWQTEVDRMKANGARFAVFQRSSSDKNEVAKTTPMVQPVQYEQTWCLWVSPTRRRATFVVGDGVVGVVIEGSTFWSNGNGRSITNGGRENFGHGQGDGQNLIRTNEYAELLRVVEISEATRFGRRAIDARVTIVKDERHERGQGVHGLTIGDPDFLELSVDRECGVLISATSWIQGAKYRTVELTKFALNPLLADDVFEIEPEFGAEWTTV